MISTVNKYEQPYVFANLPRVSDYSEIDTLLMFEYEIMQQIKAIAEIEQPITNKLLYERIKQLWGVQVASARLRNFLDKQMNSLYKDPTSDEIKTYWTSKDNSVNYIYYRVEPSRKIVEIPCIEIMNAAYAVMQQQLSMPKEELMRLTSKTLGFASMGSQIKLATANAIDKLIILGSLKEDNGVISVA